MERRFNSISSVGESPQLEEVYMAAEHQLDGINFMINSSREKRSACSTLLVRSERQMNGGKVIHVGQRLDTKFYDEIRVK